MKRPCIKCGAPQSDGAACRRCRPPAKKPPGRDIATAAWSSLSREILSAWRARFGEWCPGDGVSHPPHFADRASNPLTVDHIVERHAGGALLDRSNLRVLCRRANSSRPTRPRGGGGAPDA